MLERGGKRLTRLAAVFTRLFPNHPHDIPGAHEMNIGKLGSGGAVTSDTCNAALKTSRLLEEAIVTAAKEMGNEEPAVLQIRCWNHLRNVWVGGMTKKLSAHLNDVLHDELKAIDFRLRVSTSFESVLRALDKEFSLCANYPKGHGEEFLPWMELRHPGALLCCMSRAQRARARTWSPTALAASTATASTTLSSWTSASAFPAPPTFFRCAALALAATTTAALATATLATAAARHSSSDPMPCARRRRTSSLS